MKRSLLLAFLMTLLTSAVITSARAAVYPFNIVGFNDCTLTAYIAFTDNGNQSIDIYIKNTTDETVHPDARLTAFAFNLPYAVSASPMVDSGGWTIDYKKDAIDTPGLFGYFDVAGITGPNFNGGNPNYGIGPGQYMIFRIYLTASVSVEDILGNGNLSYDPPGNPREYVQYFIGRFQRTGIYGEDSDVAIPEPTEDPEEFPGGDPV